MGKNLFLEGPMGAGKTTLLFETLREYEGLKVGGFAVKRVYDKDRVIAMDMVDLYTDESDTLLWVISPTERKVNLSCFHNVGVSAIRNAQKNADVIIMDELGRFELKVPSFLQAVKDALDGPKAVIGILKDESNTFLDGVRERPDTQTVHIEEDTRDSAKEMFRGIFFQVVGGV